MSCGLITIKPRTHNYKESSYLHAQCQRVGKYLKTDHEFPWWETKWFQVWNLYQTIDSVWTKKKYKEVAVYSLSGVQDGFLLISYIDCKDVVNSLTEFWFGPLPATSFWNQTLIASSIFTVASLNTWPMHRASMYVCIYLFGLEFTRMRAWFRGVYLFFLSTCRNKMKLPVLCDL